MLRLFDWSVEIQIYDACCYQPLLSIIFNLKWFKQFPPFRPQTSMEERQSAESSQNQQHRVKCSKDQMTSFTRECSGSAQAQCGLQKWHFIPIIKASQVIKWSHVWRVETDCRVYMEWSGDMKTSRVVVFSAGARTGGWWRHWVGGSRWRERRRPHLYILHRLQGHTLQFTTLMLWCLCYYCYSSIRLVLTC